VIGALAHLDELLEALDIAQNAGDAAIAGRRPRVVGVAGEADLVALGDGDDALEEVVDGMPAAATFSMRRQIESIWRSRLGPLVRMSGLCDFSTTRDAKGSCTMSRMRPHDSIRSRCALRISSVQSWGLPSGSALTWRTPNCAN
jgi:hypothetical protein